MVTSSDVNRLNCHYCKFHITATFCYKEQDLQDIFTK